MKSAVAAFMIAAALALPAGAQAAATNDVAKVEGGQFTVDKSHAKILFSIEHFGFSIYYGIFTDFDASLRFNPKQLTKSAVDVTVHMAGIDTTNPKLDAHLKSADFFDVAKYPTATFKSTGIVVTGPTTGRITGDLTLHGVTRPIVLNATFIGGGVNPLTKAYVVGFSATATLKRSDYGVKAFIPAVGDAVNLIISGEFDRRP